MGLLTLQEIFCQSYPDYARTHRVPAHQRKAARAIMQGRTAALGGHVQACPEGHFSRIWYNSCRHRSCPQCAYIQSERWLAKQRSRLLACDHYHVIFTVPHDLNPLWLLNQSQMTGLLFQTVRDTLMELLGDPKYLGAQPGMLLAFHSWGRTLVWHPHVHCLVTGGGVSPTGKWVSVRRGYLLPVHVGVALFRGKFIGGLRRLWQRGALRLPEEMRAQALLNLLNRLGHAQKTRWNVHIRERYAHGQGVATYVARYMRGGPLKNRQLVGVDGERVTFTSHDHREASTGGSSSRQMTLPVEGFIRRVLEHVVPSKTQVVRCYGLYHASKADTLGAVRAVLGQEPLVVGERPSWQEVCAAQGDVHPESCPVCGRWLVCTGTGATPWRAWGTRAGRGACGMIKGPRDIGVVEGRGASGIVCEAGVMPGKGVGGRWTGGQEVEVWGTKSVMRSVQGSLWR